MFVKNQKFLVLGVSKSGYQAAKYLLDKHAVCYFYEEMSSEKIAAAKAELSALGATEALKEGIDAVLNDIDAVIISPGVPINHPVAVKAKSMGKRILGELEFAYEQFSPTFIAITGTNGKTTTVSLVSDILNQSGIAAKTVGNIGVPLTQEIDGGDKNSVFITEVSSFQLESVSAFCPHISCVLNISPDHLERHYTMENYVFLKKRVFANQKETEYCVLNYDDETVRSFYTAVKAKALWVSLRGEVDGAYLSDGVLYFKGEMVMSADEVPVSGEHNLYNALFAIAVSRLLGVSAEDIARAIKGFRGVPYRNQLVLEKNGVKFVNDSKSTNTASAITAIRAARIPTVLILGGSEKGETYDGLFECIKNSSVKHTVITGKSRRNMLAAADRAGYTDITVCTEFDTAVKIAVMMAESGEQVLLSPACASFDEFSSYIERGERFNKIAGEL
nr:UDP-N-acetylmuramoyl-L-alanine--D-glutamate ligase [Clostridia bacterium]